MQMQSISIYLYQFLKGGILKMSEEVEAKQVAFNMSIMQIQEVFRLLQESTNCYLKGNYRQMFFTLKAVKLSVIQSLSPEQRQSLENQEQAITKCETKAEWFKGTEKYRTLLMDILEEKGYLIKKMEDYKKMF